MIQYDPKSWFSLIIDVYSRYVFRSLLPLLLFVGLFTTFYCFVVVDILHLEYKGTMQFHSIIGIILGLFLVFRINTAYDRWWEGRKLWGQLVNDTRNLAIKLDSMLPRDATEDRNFFCKMIPNISFVFKEHLKDSILLGELDFVDNENKRLIITSKHRPNQVVNMIYERIILLNKKGIISETELSLIDKEMKGFIDIIGGCERIKSTPIPYSFSMFIKKFLFVYTITLPISFALQFGYWSVAIVVTTFYFLVSVELISEEIEDPFGDDVNDLPLNQICLNIRNNINEIFSIN